MREISFAFGMVAVLLCVQVLAQVLPTPTLLTVGLLAIALGLVVSVPAAIVYHVRLAQVLGPRGELDRGWLWHPTRLHVYLRSSERRSVLAWFVVGVAGWTTALAGCALVGLSLRSGG